MVLRMHVRSLFFALSLVAGVLAAQPPVLADSAVSSGYRWVMFDPPGTGFSSSAIAVNNRGDIAGTYYTADGDEHMYIQRLGRFTALDYPSCHDHPTDSTIPNDINNRGDIVGQYAQDYSNHGFYYHDGVFHQFDRPGYIVTDPIGINDAGDIVGMSQRPDFTFEYFTYIRGIFATISIYPPIDWFLGFRDINNGGTTLDEFAGNFGPPSNLALPNSPLMPIYDFQGQYTEAFGINNHDDVVGFYRDYLTFDHGFILHEGNYTTLDLPFPTPMHSAVWSHINDLGVVVGWAVDPATSRQRSFVGVPVQ